MAKDPRDKQLSLDLPPTNSKLTPVPPPAENITVTKVVSLTEKQAAKATSEVAKQVAGLLSLVKHLK